MRKRHSTPWFLEPNQLGRYLLVPLLLLCYKTFPQIGESKVKAALIYNFGQNVEWMNEKQITTYQIGVVCADTSILHELKQVASNYKLKNKPIEVKRIMDMELATGCQMVFLDEENSRSINEMAEVIKGKNLLLITDKCPDRLLVMINLLYDKAKKTLSFEINRHNLEAEGFTIKPEILLHGGSYVDIKQLYNQTYEQLKLESQRIKEYQVEIEAIKREKSAYQQQIETLNSQIRDLNERISTSQEEFNSLNRRIEKKDSLLYLRTQELQRQVNESRMLQRTIQEQIKAVEGSKARLAELDGQIAAKESEIEEKQIIINKQDSIIDEKENLITKQQRGILYIAILAITLILAFVVALIAFQMKRQLNRKLEILVEERTRELRQSQEHFIGLFENSPVAVLELDLSGLKEYIQNLASDQGMTDTKDEQTFNKIKEGVKYIKIKDLNQATLRLFGYPNKGEFIRLYAQTFTDQSVWDLKHAFDAISRGELKTSYETVRLTSQGEVRNLHLIWIALPGSEISYSNVLLTMSDITELKRYQAELQKHRDHLEEIVVERTNEILDLNRDLSVANAELNERKEELEETINMLRETQNQLIQSEKMASLGMLAAGIAHEINNPLNFISASQQAMAPLLEELRGKLSRFREEATPKSPDEIIGSFDKSINIHDTFFSLKFLLENIEAGIKRTTEITQSLTAYLRNDSESFRDFDIRRGIKDALVILKSKWAGRIEVKEQFGEVPEIRCNAGGINQVIMNLISNAIDAIPDKGEITLMVKHDREAREVVLSVKDNGRGIAPELHAKIFDPFFTTKEVGKGTGLGLYLTYGIVKQHNGSIEVASEVGKGSEFTVRLPVNRA